MKARAQLLKPMLKVGKEGLSPAFLKAVDEAVASLALDSSYTGTKKHDFGKGTIESKVEPLGPGLYDVVATAVYDGRKRVVDAQVFRATGTASVRSWRRVPG